MTLTELLIEADKHVQEARLRHESAARALHVAREECKAANAELVRADAELLRLGQLFLNVPAYKRRRGGGR